MSGEHGVFGALVTLLAVILVFPGSHQASTGPAATTTTCTRKCGNIDVPYPFGLDTDDPSCYMFPASGFRLRCNKTASNPPKLMLGGIEVLDISVPIAKARLLLSLSLECFNASGSRVRNVNWNVWLPRNYAFSSTDNTFTGVGCDTVARIMGRQDQKFSGGCISTCDNTSRIIDGDCSGIGCCQAAVPRGLPRYGTSFLDSGDHGGVLDLNACSYSFLVQKGNYTFSRSDLRGMDSTRLFPVVADWSAGNQTCRDAVRSGTSYACISSNSECVDSVSVLPGYVCNCSQGYEGNPYISGGCTDIDECKDPNTYPCHGTCTNIPGSYNCVCPAGTEGDPKVQGGCRPVASSGSSFRAAVVVPVVVASSLLAMALSIWVYSLLQRKKFNQLKEKCFMQNGGQLLQKRIASTGTNEDVFKIFTQEDIDKATNKYDQALVLGRGGQGVVYKGKLPNDSRTFAIKKSIVLDGSKIEEFINELVILSKINHRNIVRIVGCCLEVEDPLLVYEFVENGTLSEHIKNGSLPWDIRLKIAAEAAGALAYLHSSTNVPIIHRDVKSSNILLDLQYNAKVSDFGASKLVMTEELQVQTVVLGTLGYLDPEYMLTHQLTDKSDVYSYGVVLAELLTGKAPLSYERIESERCLAMHFMSCMRANTLEQILDAKIVDPEIFGQMKEVALLAQRCLSMTGETRPTMKEVAMELEGLRRSSSYPWIPRNGEENQSLLGEPSMADLTSLSNYYLSSGENMSSLHIESGR